MTTCEIISDYLPTRGTPKSTGYDVYCDSIKVKDDYIEFGTGIKLQISDGYYFELVPRSSISKTKYIMCNSPGIIDEDYTGEIKMRVRINNPNGKEYVIGDKIGQLILRKRLSCEFNSTETIIETSRGSGGFGSTGN